MRKHNVNVQKRKKHYTVGAILWLIVEYVSLIFFGLCAVVPVISCVITAFKTQEEYQTTNVMTLPKNWLNFDNFIKAFQTADMGRAFLNSVIVMVSVLVVSIIIGTQLAYVLNRFKFPGNGLIRNLFLFASLLPAVAMQVTVYNIMTALHFVNHFGMSKGIAITILTLRWPVAFLALYLMAFLSYYILPDLRGNESFKRKSALPGTLFFTTFWLVGSWGFSIYVNNLSTYNLVYGTIGAFFILMVWLYYTSILLLIGGEINSQVYNQLEHKSRELHEEIAELKSQIKRK